MTLFDFQKKGLEELKNFKRCAFYWDMGTGKTFVGAEKLIDLNNPFNLVVCQKSKVKDWCMHFLTTYGSKKCVIYDLTRSDQMELFLSQSPKSCWKFIGVINYDLLIRRSELKKLTNFTLMLDESQAIQNDSSLRTKFIVSMKPDAVVLLSGTPVNAKYEQLYSQCKLLGWKISKTDFWERYIEYRSWKPAPKMPPIKLVTGYKNVEELKFNLRKHGANFLKTEEVLTLPEQVFQTVNVPVSREYKKFMKQDFVTVEGETLVGDDNLSKLLYARQLCGIYNKDKLKAVEDWINSTEERVIIFYNFNEELNRLKKITNKPISVINGNFKNLSAYEEHSNSVTFVQYQSGAAGLNLQKARRMAFFSLPLSFSHFEQSKKRIHRIGQNETCFYYNFICEDSVEEDILANLIKGKDYTNRLFEKENYERQR